MRTKKLDLCVDLVKSQRLIDKLFFKSGVMTLNDFCRQLSECNKGTLKQIVSKPIKVSNRVYYIIFEHEESIYKTMCCRLKLYFLKNGEPELVYTDIKPSYIRLKASVNGYGTQVIGEIRLNIFFRKCLSIIFGPEHTAFRTIMTLDLFCKWTEEFLFNDVDAPDLATYLYQRVNAKNVEAFNYCLENSPNIVYKK